MSFPLKEFAAGIQARPPPQLRDKAEMTHEIHFTHSKNSNMAVHCLDYALHYISRFPKTEKELRIQLMTKWYVSLDIDKAMIFLKEKDFINDKKFTEAYLRSECGRKGKPLITITQKLREKWVDKDIIREIAKSMEHEMNEWIAEKIKKDIAICKKRWEDGFDIIQRLMKKGYRLDDIKKVINNK